MVVECFQQSMASRVEMAARALARADADPCKNFYRNSDDFKLHIFSFSISLFPSPKNLEFTRPLTLSSLSSPLREEYPRPNYFDQETMPGISRHLIDRLKTQLPQKNGP